MAAITLPNLSGLASDVAQGVVVQAVVTQASGLFANLLPHTTTTSTGTTAPSTTPTGGHTISAAAAQYLGLTPTQIVAAGLTVV
jgi:hypothetical protein